MRDAHYIRLGDSTVGQCHAWPPHGHPGWPWSQSAALWTLLTSGSLGLGFLSVASGSSIRGGVTEFQCPGVLVGRDIPAQVVPLGPRHSGFPWSLFTLQSDHLSHAVSLGAGGRWREGTGPGSCHIVRQFWDSSRPQPWRIKNPELTPLFSEFLCTSLPSRRP